MIIETIVFKQKFIMQFYKTYLNYIIPKAALNHLNSLRYAHIFYNMFYCVGNYLLIKITPFLLHNLP